MRIIPHTCHNCYSNYGYQASGDGCQRPENDGIYCPQCKLNILEALSRVPKTAKWVSAEVHEPDELARVHAKRAHDVENPSKFMGMTVRELSQHTFKFIDGKAQVAEEYVPVRIDGVKYTIIVNKLEKKPTRVTKQALRDLASGNIFQPHGWKD
jgi:hypothetical protein